MEFSQFTVRRTCAVEAVEAAFVNCCHPKLYPPPKLPKFPQWKCDINTGAQSTDCCGSSSLTIICVLLALLALLISLVLGLRYFKRKMSRVAIDITNVTGAKKTTTNVTFIGIKRNLSKDSNGVSATVTYKEVHVKIGSDQSSKDGKYIE